MKDKNGVEIKNGDKVRYDNSPDIETVYEFDKQFFFKIGDDLFYLAPLMQEDIEIVSKNETKAK